MLRPLNLHARTPPVVLITFPGPCHVQDTDTDKTKCAVSGSIGICSVNFQLDHIQNDRLSAIINFGMLDTGQTVPDS